MAGGSLRNIRYKIARHLKSLRGLDIVKDVAFTASNEIFGCKQTNLKRMAKGAVPHFTVISDTDLKLIGGMVLNNPNNFNQKSGSLSKCSMPGEVWKMCTIVRKGTSSLIKLSQVNLASNFVTILRKTIVVLT